MPQNTHTLNHDGNQVVYSWTISGTGATITSGSTTNTIVVDYTVVGSYTVIGTATNNCTFPQNNPLATPPAPGSKSISKTVNIVQPLVPCTAGGLTNKVNATAGVGVGDVIKETGGSCYTVGAIEVRAATAVTIGAFTTIPGGCNANACTGCAEITSVSIT